MDPLDSLRDRIRQIDRQILTLIGERLEVASQVGAEKKRRGEPLRDWNVERIVLDHAKTLAENLGVSPTLARNVMQHLISGSRAEQERHVYSTYTGSAKSIAVIGGRGKMGRWFTDFFVNQGHHVGIFDPRSTTPSEIPDAITTFDSLTHALENSSVVVIATPLEQVPHSIDGITNARYQGTVFDIASLKGHLKITIARAREAGISITSIHPMFGPEVRALADQVVCMCDCGNVDANRRVREFFTDTAATIVDLSVDEHDRIVSYVLGLSHLVNLLFARVLATGGDSLDRLTRVGSTTFHSQMDTTSTVIRENPELYFAIQRLNPFTPHLYQAVTKELKDLIELVLKDDLPGFAARMKEGERWVAGDQPVPPSPQ